jgi:hypothetical protein
LPGCPVKARKRPDGLKAGKLPINVHRAQLRLVEARLVLLGDDQHLIGFGIEAAWQLGFEEAVQMWPR